MKVTNRTVIYRLSFKSMKKEKARNIIAICAIVRTTMLLFTVALSINDALQQANKSLIK